MSFNDYLRGVNDQNIKQQWQKSPSQPNNTPQIIPVSTGPRPNLKPGPTAEEKLLQIQKEADKLQRELRRPQQNWMPSESGFEMNWSKLQRNLAEGVYQQTGRALQALTFADYKIPLKNEADLSVDRGFVTTESRLKTVKASFNQKHLGKAHMDSLVSSLKFETIDKIIKYITANLDSMAEILREGKNDTLRINDINNVGRVDFVKKISEHRQNDT